jgi:hypothetical protein
MPVTTPAGVRGRLYALQALAGALCAIALVAFFARPNSFGFLLLGVFAIIVGMRLARRSSADRWRAPGQIAGKRSAAKATRPEGPVAWALLAASLVGLVVAYHIARSDALRWYKKEWPVDVVCGVILALYATRWYLGSKLPR